MTNNKKSSVYKEFVPYEEALALEELGFDEKNILAYHTIEDKRLVNGYSLSANGFELKAPTFSQAFRWFREKYNLHAVIMSKITPSNTTVYYIYKGKIKKDWNNCFESYEEAELACLRKLIEIVKEVTNEQQ